MSVYTQLLKLQCNGQINFFLSYFSKLEDIQLLKPRDQSPPVFLYASDLLHLIF